MPAADTPEKSIIRTIAAPQSIPRRPQSSTSSLPLILLAGLVVPALLAYAFATADDAQVVGGIVGLIALVAILSRPRWGLVFFVGLLYVRPEESIPALAGMHFTLIVALVTLVGMWFQFFVNRQSLVRSPLTGMILGFCVIGVASSLSNGNGGEALLDLSRLAVLVLLVINLIRSPEDYQSLVISVLVFTVYLAGYSLYLYHTGSVVLQDGVERPIATGLFSDPNDLASMFVAGLALALARMVNAKTMGRVTYLLVAGLLLYATLLTSSRGGMLALLVVAGGFSLGYLRQKPLAAVAAILVAGALMTASGRMTNFDSTETSANSRFWFWDNGFNLLYSHPFLGIGYNQFVNQNGGFTAHNSFVLCFAELGLLGFFFWMGCLYYCYWNRPQKAAAGGANGAPPPEPAPVTASAPSSADAPVPVEATASQDLFGARLCLAAYLAASFWLSHTYTPVLYLLMCLPVSAQVAWGGSSQTPLPWEERRRDWGRIAVLCLGTLVFVNLVTGHYK